MVSADDQRFRELIRTEFGEEVVGSAPDPREDPSCTRGRWPGYFSMAESLERNAPDDDSWARWDPGLAPVGSPGRMRLTGWVFLLAAVLVGAVALGGVTLPGVLRMGMVLCVLVGLGFLLASVPHHREPGDEPGAVV